MTKKQRKQVPAENPVSPIHITIVWNNPKRIATLEALARLNGVHVAELASVVLKEWVKQQQEALTVKYSDRVFLGLVEPRSGFRREEEAQ